MKMMRMALLGGAALAVSASGAFAAEDLDTLKAQLEALNARVQQLESTPAIAPNGASFLTFGEAATPAFLLDERAADRMPALVNNISVLAAADAAPSTVISWNGEIRAALTWTEDGDRDYDRTELGLDGLAGDQPGPDGILGSADDTNDDVDVFSFDDDIEINTRARIWVTATTETAVGEVGVYARIQGTADDWEANSATVNSYRGWWKFAPDWTFSGGYGGTAAAVNHGLDEYAQFGATIYHGGPDAEYLRLNYVSGPFEWNGAIEDYRGSDRGGNTSTSLRMDSDLPAVTGNLNWSNDGVSARVMGGIASDESGGFDPTNDVDWVVGAGATFALGDMATFSMGGRAGEGWGGFNNRTTFLFGDTSFWDASAYLRFDVSENTFSEIGVAYADVNNSGTLSVINAGLYYKPVDQLKMGIQGDWVEVNPEGRSNTSDSLSASFVTWWSF